MLFFREVFDLGWLILVVDTPFPPIPFHVGDLVDGERMSSVNGSTVELLGSCDGLLWCLIFDKSIARQMSLGSCVSREWRHTLPSYRCR